MWILSSLIICKSHVNVQLFLYWMSEKIRSIEDILQESGGFGCGHVNEAYVEEEFQESEYNEEESGGDEVESDGEEDLCDEDEEDFDVNKVSDVEVIL